MEVNVRYTCINCGNPVKNLYKKYSSTVLKLTECEFCGQIADKYVEYDTVIIIIDLVLLKLIAYRHILLNSQFKNFWKLSVVLLLLETYSNWALSNKEVLKVDLDSTEPQLAETNLYLDDFKFYKMSLNVVLSTFIFVTLIYFLTKCYTFIMKSEAISFIAVSKTMTLSGSSMFLLFPSLIWDITVHEYHIQFISLYTTLSQLLAYRAICNCAKFWCIVVIFSSSIIKMYTITYLKANQLF